MTYLVTSAEGDLSLVDLGPCFFRKREIFFLSDVAASTFRLISAPLLVQDS